MPAASTIDIDTVCMYSDSSTRVWLSRFHFSTFVCRGTGTGTAPAAARSPSRTLMRAHAHGATTMLLRTLTLAVAVACASAAAAGGGRWRNLRKRRQTAGTGYTMLAGKTIGGTANIMRGVKGWTNAACKKKCDESATGCRFRTVRTCCFSYVFNPKDGYCELWSRGYKSAGASWNIRSGCSSGCMKNSRTGSSLYLKSAAWTPPPTQSPTTPLPTRRPTARAGYCTVKPEKVCKYCGDFCKLKGLCTPIAVGSAILLRGA